MAPTIDVRNCARRLESLLPRYLADLQTLVDIDSGTFDKAGNDAVIALLRQRYEALGGECRLSPLADRGDVLTVRLDRGGSHRVLLLGHTDTVYAAGTAARRPFRIDGSRAFGPGVADMKGGDLSICYALEALLSDGQSDIGDITVLHNTDEEVGSPDSRELISKCSAEADAVLVLEPGRENGDIVSARKGIASIEITVHGRSAHAGVNHERGRSAALELAHLLIGLEGLNGSIPGVTVNVGKIEGGERANVVPDHATALGEARAVDRASLDQIVQSIAERVRQRTVADTEAELRIEIEHFPMHRSEETARLVRLAQSLASQLDIDLNDTATGGASDGNTAAQLGRPVLDGLGPVGGAAHSPDEYLLVPSVVPRTAILAGLIATIGRGGA